ncbi:DUF2079 domain-containing protein [Leptospira congkakensis]|uniref:DUF2079 domain-containing protein n=1 Tax=Leptospira congkakensis TaxID=2484932 RepID=A0A4Z1ACQ0_9LEPT|nr:DUF2079 domain-containing protein [Leptospira congkakensis]TGL87684.1 DUF2079 domain-containing protein [Leptospira congkakensis]TGL89700.1 DUF2079 domain-containing protein [Leptospira congkakensis]TGL95834.1 DUF2079 domain-containing protein [Leptospira congkakensis]
MVYLFFLFSLVSPFLFISPKNFHAPFQKGVFLFLFLLTIISFWKEKKTKSEAKPNDKLIYFSLLSDKQIKILPYLLCISCIIFFIGSTYHAFQLTKSLADAFLFQDADYIGISDILLSISRGEGFTSGYYSESGIGSYLHHHFAPGMFVLSPFANWIPERWGLAVGVFFVYQLATFLWLFWAYQISKDNLKEKGSKFLVFWVLLTNQLYLYRIGSSFHFEVLVLLFALFFFYIWEERKKIQNVRSHFFWFYYSILSFVTILYLSLKEDIGIYLLLFFLPTVLGFIYKHNQENRKPGAAKRWVFFSIEDKIHLHSLILIISIVFLWMGFVFFIYPIFGDLKESVSWANVLTQEYHSAFKQVTGFQKSFQIFLELITSGGLGIFQMLPEVIGIGLVYATHIFSSRPWHHEVYTYYSYSLVPFILYTGILWIQSEKKISLSFAFLILTCLFWKNSLDQNFPLDTNIKSPWKNEAIENEVREDLKNANLLILSNPLKIISPNTNLDPNTTSNLGNDKNLKTKKGICVFSQYNLSFQITDQVKTYPLEQIKNAASICEKASHCYMVLAAEFTDEILWPKSRILEYKKELENQNGSLVWKGEQIEVWKLKAMN